MERNNANVRMYDFEDLRARVDELEEKLSNAENTLSVLFNWIKAGAKEGKLQVILSESLWNEDLEYSDGK